MSACLDLRVLVVDDVATMRRIMRGLLKDMGCPHIEEAEDGAAALQCLRSQRIDFVISDTHMPTMDGFELLAQIKRDPALAHLPVLMVTAEASKDDILRAARTGAAGYIVKPFTRATLEEKMTRIVQKMAATV
jgi:two-component system chemotaxis response regulator CheY